MRCLVLDKMGGMSVSVSWLVDRLRGDIHQAVRARALELAGGDAVRIHFAGFASCRSLYRRCYCPHLQTGVTAAALLPPDGFGGRTPSALELDRWFAGERPAVKWPIVPRRWPDVGLELTHFVVEYAGHEFLFDVYLGQCSDCGLFIFQIGDYPEAPA